MSERAKRARAQREKRYPRTMGAFLRGPKPPRTGVSDRTRLRDAKRQREIEAAWKVVLQDFKLLSREPVDRYRAIKEQFSPAELKKLGASSPRDLLPEAFARLYAKAHQLQLDNTALREQLNRAAPAVASDAYRPVKRTS
jgi:hypothetical protein